MTDTHAAINEFASGTTEAGKELKMVPRPPEPRLGLPQVM